MLGRTELLAKAELRPEFELSPLIRAGTAPMFHINNAYTETQGVPATVESVSETKRLVVNGEARDTAVRSLAGLLDELGYGGQKVATAINGDFVPERARQDTRLSPGDEIEIVAPRQGG